MTTANADPRLAPRGAVTDATSVWPARTDTIWLPVASAPPRSPWAISVRRTRAAPAGADSTTEAARPDPVVFPATTACSLMGAVAAVKAPAPLPGTSTPATTGTFEVISSAAAVPPSGVRAT